MSKGETMIRAATARYETVARVQARVRDILDNISPDLEKLAEACVTDKPNMTFEEVVTELVKECTFQLSISNALA